MNLCRLKQRSNGSRGAALIELALCLPIIILLAIGSIEFVRILTVQSSIKTVVRETGSFVFRRCAWHFSPNQCLRRGDIVTGLFRLASVVPNTKIIVSVYELDSSDQVVRKGMAVSIMGNAPIQDSRYNVVDVRDDFATTQASLSAINRRIAVVEIRSTFSTLTNVISGIFSNPNHELYEALVL